jgi:hypothetical protein
MTDDDLLCVASATAYQLVSEGTWTPEMFHHWFEIQCSEQFETGVRMAKSGMLG